MILEILHQLHPTFNDRALGVLTHVATLTTDQPFDTALEIAFAETQNIDAPWVLHHAPELAPMPGAHRSTSVGDVVVADDAKAFQCASAGWREADIGLVRVMRGRV